ncbi:MAG: hypothetical protein EU541_06655, partial [Promethearchaeota archaeon]
MKERINLLKLEGKSSFEMGYEQGNTYQTEIKQMYDDLTNSEDFLALKPLLIPKFLFIKLVNSMSSKKVSDAIKEHLPSQWKFLKGIRKGANIKTKELLFLQALDALGTQIQDYKLGDVNLTYGKCSAVGITGEHSSTGKPLIIKNWDGPETLGKYIFFRHIIPEENNKYSTLSSGVSGLAGINNGMNEKGLSIVYNYAYPKDIGESGIPAMFLIREALERCKTVSETVELFTSYPRIGGANIMIGDQDGRLAVIEMGPKNLKIRNSTKETRDYLICTNHYLTTEMELNEIPRNAIYDKNAPSYLQNEPIYKSSLLRYQAASSILETEIYDKVDLNFLNTKIQQNHGPNNKPSKNTFCNHGPHISTGFGVMLD